MIGRYGCRLAHAVAAKQRHDLAVVDIEIHIEENLARSIRSLNAGRD